MGEPVHYQRKRLLVDGRPELLLAGEVHYFRLPRAQWQDRLDKANAAGLNTISTYVPWLWHELTDGTFDFSGRSKPERDLDGFLDLCRASGLHVIARPGPFVMAELKNEGIPFRIYAEHPEVVPIGWDGAPAPSRVVDYLAPAFLRETRAWYRAVMPRLALRLRRKGGPVVAVQLDNEVGMLAWVTNSPDLSYHALAEFQTWLKQKDREYPAGVDFRSPDDDVAAAVMRDLGEYSRHRFARYFQELRGYAEEFGVTGVPFLINVHGTEQRRAETFPVGISQLMTSATGVRNTLLATDVYLGDLGAGNVAELYLVNAFCDAVLDADQPLTAMEFEAGDHWRDLTGQCDPSAVDLKTRLCLAQGNRLLNYYLFAGGVNPPLDEPAGDGNDRLAFTGERHGAGAPIGAEGQINPSFGPLQRVLRAVRAVSPALADMREEHDEVALGFVPDHYLTEYHYPGSAAVRSVLDDVVGTRGAGPGGVLARAMLLGGFRFGAVNVQDRLDPVTTPVLAFAGTSHLSEDVQRKLVDYLDGGGRLLLAGRLPVMDMTGAPCTVLRDHLGLRPLGAVAESRQFFPSVTAAGWAAPRAETRVSWAELYEPAGDPVLRELSTGHACGFDIPVGVGRAVVIAADYECDLDLWRTAFAALGTEPAIRHTAPVPGVLTLSTVDGNGGRILHALNVSGYDQKCTVTEFGSPLFGGEPLLLPGRRGLMLPLNLTVGGLHIEYATAEVVAATDNTVTFRAPAGEAVVAARGDLACPGAETVARNGATVLRVRGAGEFTVARPANQN